MIDWRSFVSISLSLLVIGPGCRSPSGHREKADRQATEIIEQKREELFGESTPFTIELPADQLRRTLLLEQDLPISSPSSLGSDKLEPIPHWPEAVPEASVAEPTEKLPDPFKMNLYDALSIGAKNNRDYQSRKEDIFRAALSMNVEAEAFRNTYIGALESVYADDRSGDETERGVVNSAALGVSRAFRTGVTVSGRLALDLVNLLTADKDSAYGLLADLTVSVPLLRGAGRHIVTEPLTQADRNVMYAMYDFEDFKRSFAVRIASEYFGVLQQLDQVRNAEENLRGLEVSATRARRLADAGRLPEIQVDQALQEQLRARERWLLAQASYEERLDRFKLTLGLPGDVRVELDGEDLVRLVSVLQSADSTDPIAIDEIESLNGAFERRPDLLKALGRVYDAQRAVTVAADGLRWDAKLSAGAKTGGGRSLSSAGSGNVNLEPDRAVYGATLALDAPWNRVKERDAYRASFINLERAVRAAQDLEDQIKIQVRSAWRSLRRARESITIQTRSVELAQRRVDSTALFLQAGRTQIRDVLEAQEALISARNALTASIVAYRVAELEWQRDLALLEVDEQGLWKENTRYDQSAN